MCKDGNFPLLVEDASSQCHAEAPLLRIHSREHDGDSIKGVDLANAQYREPLERRGVHNSATSPLFRKEREISNSLA